MQQAFIIKDQPTLDNLNKILAEEEHYIEQISPNPNGSWLVILDEADDFELADLDMFEEQTAS